MDSFCVSLVSLEDLVASLEGVVVSFVSPVSLGEPEEGSVLVLSTSPPGDVYWLTQPPSEAPIKMIRNKEQNLI